MDGQEGNGCISPPPNSPDVAPCKLFFQNMKFKLKGKRCNEVLESP